MDDTHRTRIASARALAQRSRDLSADNLSTLRRARLDARLTQRSLSILAGCSRDAVSRSERLDPRVSNATLRRLCAVLGVPVADARR